MGRFYLLDIHCDYSFISPLCGVARTPDCGMFVIYLFFYKPFMWCRSDARLRHVCYLFILYKPFMWRRSDARLRHACYFLSFISPFMWRRSDARLRHACCLFIFYKPFLRYRSDARLRHYYFICNLSRSHFRHSTSTFYFYSRIACSYFPACVHHRVSFNS